MKWNINIVLLLGLSIAFTPFIAASDDAPSLTAEAPALVPEEPAETEEPDKSGDAEAEEPITAESVSKEIESAIQENSAEDLLNLATEIKLSADTIIDLTKTIAYCTEAEKKGLSGDNAEYCHQLKLASQLERGLAMAKIFMDDSVQPEELMGKWQVIRAMALDDLEAAAAENPDLAITQLAIGRLQMFPGGDIEKAKSALNSAIENAGEGDHDILVEALKFRAMLEEEPSKVKDLLERALTISPDDPELQYLLAAQFTDTYREEEALELINKALDAVPGEKRYMKAKAAVLAALGQKEEALKLYDETLDDLRLDTEEEKLLNSVQRGEFLSSIGEYEEAIQSYTTLIEEKPVCILFYLRAVAYFQIKDYKHALKDANKAIGLDSSFSDAVRLKALIYIQQERYSDAIPLLEKLCLYDENEGITAQLAYTMAQNDQFTEGISRIDALLEKNPSSIVLLRGKADIYLMYGRWNDAIAIYEKILEIAPKDSGVLNNYAWVLATSPDDSVRNGSKALELALRAAEETSYRESYILSTLGAAYAETGDFEKAKEWSEKGVTIAEKEKEERLDELKNELESYKKGEPWREAQQKTGDASDPLPPEAAEFF